MSSKAFISGWVDEQDSSILAKVCAVCAGVAFLVLSSQIVIPLPWTPVPITGQTFAVTLTALLFGRNLGLSSFLGYIGLAAIGLPVLVAAGALVPGPTLGYLLGMAFSVTLVGEAVDRGYAKGFWQTLGIAYLGSACVFVFGLLGLSYFLPGESLIAAGLLPFLPGDLVKNLLAVLVAQKFKK